MQVAANSNKIMGSLTKSNRNFNTAFCLLNSRELLPNLVRAAATSDSVRPFIFICLIFKFSNSVIGCMPQCPTATQLLIPDNVLVHSLHFSFFLILGKRV